jgi:pimeloyl-ACP methyl ester carboxylesterase
MDGLDGEVSDGQIGVIAIEIMSISSRITAPALSKDEMCDEIATILAHHGWDKVVLAAHSYGTIISAHLLKSPLTAPMIGPIVFMDPVSILLHLPNVAYNFTRRRPKRANERQLHYFASTDMCISHTLARQFFWSESVLWKKDIKDRNMTFSLSGRDLIVDSEAVGRYLVSDHDASLVSSSAPLLNDGSARRKGNSGITQHTREVGDAEELVDWWKERIWTGKGIDILWFADCDHAQVFDKRATRRPLVRATRAYCAQTGADDGRSVDP